MSLIDIHAHLLYGIDDGAYDLEESMKLIDMEYEQGVRGIFCTNHSRDMEDFYKDYHKRFETIRMLAESKYPGLSLYKGCEIVCYRDEMPKIIANICKDIFPTQNGTKYILMEFSPKRTQGMEEMRYCTEYALNEGYVLILAHVERYMPIYTDPLADLMKLKELGCLAQVNFYSVEQEHSERKDLANLFLKNHLVDYMGSDTHALDYKPTEAAVGAKALREKYGDEYADKVLFENARNMLKTLEI